MVNYDNKVEPGYNAELAKHEAEAERLIAAGRLRQEINSRRSSKSWILAVVVFFVMVLYFLILFL